MDRKVTAFKEIYNTRENVGDTVERKFAGWDEVLAQFYGEITEWKGMFTLLKEKIANLEGIKAILGEHLQDEAHRLGNIGSQKQA